MTFFLPRRDLYWFMLIAVTVLFEKREIEMAKNNLGNLSGASLENYVNVRSSSSLERFSGIKFQYRDSVVRRIQRSLVWTRDSGHETLITGSITVVYCLVDSKLQLIRIIYVSVCSVRK